MFDFHTTVTVAATASFPQATGGPETETYFAVGTAVTGAGKLLPRAGNHSA